MKIINLKKKNMSYLKKAARTIRNLEILLYLSRKFSKRIFIR